MGEKATYAIFKLGAILVRAFTLVMPLTAKPAKPYSNGLSAANRNHTSSPLRIAWHYDFTLSRVRRRFLDRLSSSIIFPLPPKLTAIRPP